MREAKEHGGVPNAPAVIKPNDTSSGFTWFFDAASKMKSRKESTDQGGSVAGDVDSRDQTADQMLNDIVVQAPDISGAALINSMKTRGLVVSKVTEAWSRAVGKIKIREKKTPFECACDKVMGRGMKASKRREADSASSFAQVTIAAKPKESNMRIVTTAIRESEREQVGTQDASGHTKFGVELLVEGLGNFGDAYYYDRTALESLIPLLTGNKIYADHPTAEEDEIRPERSTRDILGHYESLRVDGDKGEQARLCGVVDILSSETWAIDRMNRAIENKKKFPDKDFVGLSINASGDSFELPIDDVIKAAPETARPKLIEAKQNGIESVKAVRQFKSAASCDLVTEAGAGGNITNYIEGR